MTKKSICVQPIHTTEGRNRALSVFEKVYRLEKGWVKDLDTLMPESDLTNSDLTWFGAFVGDRMVGVGRVLYRLPAQLYSAYDFQLTDPTLDVTQFLAQNPIAEVGRFAVLPRYRRTFRVAAELMKALGRDALDRGFTHLITDVFESDANSPWGFHRRVLGFKQVATHDTGELNCASRRITMLLDLREAERKLMGRRGWFYRFLSEPQPTLHNLPETRLERREWAML